MRLSNVTGCILLCMAIAWLVVPAFSQDHDADVAAIVKDVGDIRIGGSIPGPVVAFGEDAFVVVQGSSGPNRIPAISAARYGEGRAVVAGHESLITAEAEEGGTPIVASAARWAGDGDSPKVAIFKFDGMLDKLGNVGVECAEVSAEDVRAGLVGHDVLLTQGYHFDAEDEDAALLGDIDQFVQKGGGLITSICPWGWKYYDPEMNIATELGMNALLVRMGLAWSDGMLGATEDGAYKTDIEIAPLTHARAALAGLVDHVTDEAQLTDEELRQAGVTLSRTALAIPPDDESFLPTLHDVTAKYGGGEYPQPDAPVKTDNPFARLSATFYLSKSKTQGPDEIEAHPAAGAFPGATPADAERVTQTLAIDTTTPAWHSTGLYAPAGEVITVTVPADAADKGLNVRLGCHTDGLWGKDEWKRFPEITRSTPIKGETARIANPFGGLVYIDVPKDCELGDVDVTIAGAVRAPLFVYGETILSEWRDGIREYPGPWTELETDSIILTVPSHEIRELDNPEALMAFWDHALDLQADLAGWSRDRERPERIVADVQISAGYMHSGYPIMTWLDAPALAVDLEALTTKGSWGHFHELGHNHQSGHWTFGGTGEVTCNLFAVYVHNVAARLDTEGHPALDPEGVAKMQKEHLDAGAPYDKWQGSPFLALSMYMQIKDAFGWSPFCNVFAGYRDDAEENLPKTDDEKRDQFMVRMSREIGKNLGPFFDTWGVPVSDGAKQSIADLPAWMPENFPPEA
ncbi:MAG TPA: M60 family metallopeptidase [Armatimonadota bacterium]|nr:M60 family metallopeptidase [Armatimonadota bacterium]